MTERKTPGSLQDAFAARNQHPDKMIIAVSAPNASRVIVCDQPAGKVGEQKQHFGSEVQPG